MRFSLLITGAPCSSQAPYSAWRFANTLIEEGHELYRVFLQGDGVLLASRLTVFPTDELNITKQWSALIRENNVDAVVCISSALKRGIIDEGEAQRHDLLSSSLAEEFTISGLGQLIDATVQSDRLVTFG